MRRTVAFFMVLLLMLGVMAPGMVWAEGASAVEKTTAAPQERATEETTETTEPASSAATEETTAPASTEATEETTATEETSAPETGETLSPEPTEPEESKSLWDSIKELFGFSQDPGLLELLRLWDEKGNELYPEPSFDPAIYRYEAKVPIQGFRIEVSAYPGVAVSIGDDFLEDGNMTVVPKWSEEKEATVTLHLVAEDWDGEDYVIHLTQLPPEPTELEITQEPEKAEYLTGETFDPTGLKVLIHYSDGSTREAGETELSYRPLGALTEKDTFVTILCGELSQKLEIKVRGVLPGAGTQESPYLLATEADLRELDTWVTEGDSRAEKAFFRMENDIVITGSWDGIGDKNTPFTGDFDGDGYQITIPEGGKALFSRTREAVIHDLKLYGSCIEDYGLVSNYVVDYSTKSYANFSRVTIVSGTKTLYSGFIGGYASGQDQVLIEDCTIEDGVTIGYDKQQSHIGSFAGEFNGIVKNCRSAANVYGVKWVGGLVGNKGQSMGDFAVTDSGFSGTVSASGNYVGGIVGGGYGGTGWGLHTAPNAKGVVIENCDCTGSVSGGSGVGGIFGAEACVQQFWDNGKGSIRDNRFTGSVSGTGKYVGGIIGFMQSLNGNMQISGNYYENASKGIGAVAHVDTSAVPNGFRDGTYYYNTSKYHKNDEGEVIYENKINTVKLQQYMELSSIGTAETGSDRAVKEANLNREDDPLGADKDRLCFSEEPTVSYVRDLKLAGNYKTEYTQGEELKLDGLTITALWSDGDITYPSVEDVQISGFDPNQLGQQTVRVSYGGQMASFSVTVKPVSKDITVSVTILGDIHHSDPTANGGPHGLAKGGLTTWARETLTANTTNTVWDVLRRVAASSNLPMDASSKNQYGTVYIKGLNGLSEFDNGPNSGWMYTVNGTHPEVGVSARYLKDGDEIIFHYTDDYTYEEGSTGYGENEAKDQEKTAANTQISEQTRKELDEAFESTGDYMEKLGTPSVGPIGGEWMVIGLVRSGRTVPGEEEYYQKALEYIQGSIDSETGRLHKAKSTDNSRMILALTAIGKDVTNVGGYNLLQGLSDLDFVKYQGNNGPIWALLALDCGNYPTPEGGTTTRQALINEILRVQTSDGGWAITGDKADSDMTGMALTALAPYYEKNEKVHAAVDKALDRLSQMQDKDGGFSTSYGDGKMVATSESVSQVVTALSALGINADTDERFVKSGGSAIDALLRYLVSGGGFRHIMSGEVDGMATEQAYYALTAFDRFLSGKTSLYDMTDIINMGGDPVEATEETTEGATAQVPVGKTKAASEKPESTQFNCPWWVLAFCMFGGCGWGVAITLIVLVIKKK